MRIASRSAWPWRLGAGVDLLLDRAAEGRAGHDLADHLRALGQHLEVVGVGEVLEVDQRRRGRVVLASRSVPRLRG